jgi:high-affinity nickel-transport protein
MGGVAIGVLVASLLNGLRHGVDFDHIAAISDIAGSQTRRRTSIVLSTIYASGHALVVLTLGVAAVLLGARLPDVVDSFMGRVIGASLIVLGAYVLYSIARYGRDMRLQSRWTLMGKGARALWTKVRHHETKQVVIEHEHEHDHGGMHGHGHLQPVTVSQGSLLVATSTHTHQHRHVATLPEDPFTRFSKLSAFGIGMLHGVGAETPSQLLLFITAAGVGSKAFGVAVVVAFIVGLVVSNTAVAVASAYGLTGGRRLPAIYVGLAGVTAAFSLLLGTAYLFARDDLVSAILF